MFTFGHLLETEGNVSYLLFLQFYSDYANDSSPIITSWAEASETTTSYLDSLPSSLFEDMDESLEVMVIEEIKRFPPVNSDNFLEWRWNLETALLIGNVWRTIFARDSKTYCRRTPPKEDEPGYAEYLKISAKACIWIRMASGRQHANITDQFNDKKDAVGMYDALVENYVPSYLASRFGLYKRLSEITRGPGESWQDLIRRTNDVKFRMDLVYHRPEWTEKRLYDDLAMFTLLKNMDSQCPCFLKIIMDEDSTVYSVEEAGRRHESMRCTLGWLGIKPESFQGRPALQSTGSTSGKSKPNSTRGTKGYKG